MKKTLCALVTTATLLVSTVSVFASTPPQPNGWIYPAWEGVFHTHFGVKPIVHHVNLY